VPPKTRLGFVIPACNAEATLPQTLSSLQDQTCTDWQAIVVDDGSSDATSRIARAAAVNDTRIIAHTIPHSGASAARNFGLTKIEADWVCFLDADDWLMPEFCRVMLDAVRSEFDLIYCGHLKVAPDGGAIEIFSREFEKRGFECAARECPVAIHAVIVRRSFVESVGGFDPELATCEDWDLWQRMARAGARILAVPEFLAIYRMSASSLSRRYHQLVSDGHKVIRRGFSRDARVRRALETTANGAHGDDESVRCAFLTAWCAAAITGAGGDGAAFLAAYPIDFGGHTVALGQSLAQAMAIGARTSVSNLVSVLPRLGSSYDRLLEALAKDQHQAAVSRGLAYAIEREILHSLPNGVSAALNQVAKAVVDLSAISPIISAPDVDVQILEFLSGGHFCGRMETPIFGSLSKRDVCELALDFFGFRRFVRLCGLTLRPGYYGQLFILLARKISASLSGTLGRGSTRQDGWRSVLRQVLKEAALRIASGEGEFVGHPEMARQAITQPSAVRATAAMITSPRPEEEETRSQYWDRFFSQTDPWNYGSDYERVKYQRTLDLLPADCLDKVLELGCAEGVFTRHLAPQAKSLIAADISAIALERARTRCADCGNIDFRKLDIFTDDIPGGQTLILCSEILYYVEQPERLPEIIAKLRDALAPGGRLVMTHAFVLKDDMSATGFDWEHAFGAKVIHQTLLMTEGLCHERSIATDLYRIDCFKRLQANESIKPISNLVGLECDIDPSIARQIVWGGAWERRSDLMAREQCWDVPILAYHRIAADGPPSLRRWRVHPDMFRQQLRLLRSHGYYSITSADIVKARQSAKPLPGRPILLTFDDGYQDFADTAWPILEAEGFNAEVFVVTDCVGGSAVWDAHNGDAARLMDWEAIEGLHRKGVAFGSHLATHTPATNLSSFNLVQEARRSRMELQSHLGKDITSVAAPYGATDERYNRILASVGYRLGFSGEGNRTDIRQHGYAMQRLPVEGLWSMVDFAKAMDIMPTTPEHSSNQTLVSVIIPAYNAARTLDETLRSARHQTHRNLEILVVNDGSKDATAQIVLQHAAVDSRVRLITQPNSGVAAARNRGIAEAKSELIAPLDADDLWAPTKIEKQLQAMTRGGPRVGLVYTWFAVIDDQGTVLDLNHRPPNAGNVLWRMCRGNLVGNGSSPLMRKSAILEAGGFEPGLRAARAQGCEDLLLYFRISERHEFAVVPEHLTGYRRHAETMSEDSLQMLRSYHLVAKEMCRKHPEYGADIRLGEADLAAWLIRKALRNFRLDKAIAIFFHIARAAPKYSMASVLPGLVLRGARTLFATPQTGAAQQQPSMFSIGSPGNAEVHS
jgi:glycosyltransferase involved in cell wall biosynthesis/SAM-dependent methyltransferase